MIKSVLSTVLIFMTGFLIGKLLLALMEYQMKRLYAKRAEDHMMREILRGQSDEDTQPASPDLPEDPVDQVEPEETKVTEITAEEKE